MSRQRFLLRRQLANVTIVDDLPRRPWGRWKSTGIRLFYVFIKRTYRRKRAHDRRTRYYQAHIRGRVVVARDAYGWYVTHSGTLVAERYGSAGGAKAWADRHYAPPRPGIHNPQLAWRHEHGTTRYTAQTARIERGDVNADR